MVCLLSIFFKNLFTKIKMFLYISILALAFGESVWCSSLQFLIQGSAGRFNLPQNQSGLYAVAFFVGQLVSTVYYGHLADKSGRRYSLLCALTVTLLSSFLIAFVPISSTNLFGWAPLMTGIFFQGFGVGGAIPVTQSLVVEYFPAEERGWYTVLSSLGWPIGGMISTISAFLLFPSDQNITPLAPSSSPNSSLSPSHMSALYHSTNYTQGSWTCIYFTKTSLGSSHWPILYVWLGCFHFFSLLVVYYYLPESPRFLLFRSTLKPVLSDQLKGNQQGPRKTQQEKTVLTIPLLPEEAPTNINTTTETTDTTKTATVDSSSIYRPLILLGVVWFAVSASGNGFSTFLPIFLKDRSKSTSGGPGIYLTLISYSTVGFPAVILSSFAVESVLFGRKLVVCFSTFMASIAFVLFLWSTNAWMIFFCSCILNFVTNIAWSSVICLTSEVPPTSHRARVVSLANFIKAVSGIIGPYLCGIFASSEFSLPILFFAFIMFAASVSSLFLPNRTRGVELVDTFVVVNNINNMDSNLNCKSKEEFLINNVNNDASYFLVDDSNSSKKK
jgi:MFS family permease